MKATATKAILLAASLTFPTFGFAETTSKGAAAYNNRGSAKVNKGDVDGAIADFNRALQLDPKLAKAYMNRGIAKREKYDRIAYGAVDVFLPDYDLGTPKIQKGDLDSAIADFNHALQLDPKNAQAYINRGIAKAHRGDPDAAIGDYNRALAVDSKYALAYLNRGVAKQVKGEIDSAIVDYDHALNFNSKLADAYVDRGSAKANKGDLDGAIADLNRALQLDSKAASAYVIYVNRGTANFLARNWTAALRDYRRSCELSQRNQESRLAIWLIRSRLGEREAANKELAAHFNAESGSWVAKIEAYLLGNLSEAEFLAAAASPAINTDRGQHCEAWFYAGMKNLLDGNKRAAAEFFKKCLATGQKSIAEYHLAKAELNALGQ